MPPPSLMLRSLGLMNTPSMPGTLSVSARLSTACFDSIMMKTSWHWPRAGAGDLVRVAYPTGAMSAIQPDLGKWGGITGCLQVVRSAVQSGRWYCPHWLGAGSATQHRTAAMQQFALLYEAPFTQANSCRAPESLGR